VPASGRQLETAGAGSLKRTRARHPVGRLTATLFACILLGGCVPHYRFHDRDYLDADAFLEGVTRSYQDLVDRVIPLNQPLSNRHLVIGIPDRDLYIAGTQLQGRPPEASAEREMRAALGTSSWTAAIALYRAVEKRNLYRSVTLRFTRGEPLTPNDHTSVLYHYLFADALPRWRMVQWQMDSVDQGRLIIAPTDAGRQFGYARLFRDQLDAVEGYARGDRWLAPGGEQTPAAGN
jgi:hypothetical protein